MCYMFCNCNYITPYKEYLWNMQTTSPESKFPNKYSDVIFIQIDQHLKKLLQKYKGVPILWITAGIGLMLHLGICIKAVWKTFRNHMLFASCVYIYHLLFCHNISIMYAYLCRWCLLMQYYFVVSADKNLKNRE